MMNALFLLQLGSAPFLGFMIWALTISEDLPITSFFGFVSSYLCVLTLIGAIFFVMSFFGWFGALRDNIIALKVVSLILLVTV